jgi:hypothetical protein
MNPKPATRFGVASRNDVLTKNCDADDAQLPLVGGVKQPG